MGSTRGTLASGRPESPAQQKGGGNQPVTPLPTPLGLDAPDVPRFLLSPLAQAPSRQQPQPVVEIQPHLLPAAGAPTPPRPPGPWGLSQLPATLPPPTPPHGFSSPRSFPGLSPGSPAQGSGAGPGEPNCGGEALQIWETSLAPLRPLALPASAARWRRALFSPRWPPRLGWESRRPCLRGWLPGPSPPSTGHCLPLGLSKAGRAVGWEQLDHSTPTSSLFFKPSLAGPTIRVDLGGRCPSSP